MFLSDFSIKRPVAITMIVMSFAVLGLYSYLQLGVDNWPDVSFPFAVVSVIYPGAGPEEIETQVIQPMEDEIATIAGIRNITAQCLESRGIIFVEFELGTKIDFAALDVKDKIDAIRPNLPDDMKTPTVLKFDVNQAPIINLALQSERPADELYRLADDVVKPRLNRVTGIAQIELEGGLEREIQVALSRSRLRAHNLTVMDVIGGLAAANLSMPSGRIEEGRRDVTIRLQGEFMKPSEMEKMDISLEGGRTVRLRDIGRVYDGFKDIESKVRFGGETSVGLSLRKRTDANTVATANEVKKQLADVEKLLPADVKISVARDNSVFIRNSLRDVSGNLVMGILLTALVLFIFLRSWEGTIIASVAMPVSVVATFLLIYWAGFTLNSMSLMGLSISIGILVNNAIVVLENITVYKGRGLNPVDAAAKGTSEIALAVAASTLTNIVVFLPIGFMGGIVGQFFKEFGLTVAFATIFSLIVSFTLTPMMASRKLGRTAYIFSAIVVFFGVWLIVGLTQAVVTMVFVGLVLLAQKAGLLNRFFDMWERLISSAVQSYQSALSWILDHRGRIVAGVVVVFFVSVAMFGVVGGEFFPQADQGEFYLSVKMPPGTRLDITDQVMGQIENVIGKIPEVESYYTTIGITQTGQGDVTGSQVGGTYVKLVEKKSRKRATAEVVADIRPQLADIPAAEIVITEAGMFGGGGESDLQIEVTSNNMSNLLAVVEKIQRITSDTRGTVDVTNSWITGKPELTVIPKREQLADQGLHAADVATTLRSLFEGTVATTYRESGKEYDVRVRLEENDRSRLEQVRTLDIKTHDHWIPLASVASITEAAGPTTINRKNKERLITVSANLIGGTITDAQKEIQPRIDSLTIPADVSVAFGGEAEFMGREFAYIYQAMLLASILTYMLLCALLNSYIRPFIIMLTLPLGLIGVAFALVLTATPISMMVLMGMVMLVGIVVNNAILIIDYAQVLRDEEGKTAREATLIAAPGRFRPIIMTNIATILGMTPLALGVGAGAEWRAPMAIASIGALISSTVLTLFFVPAIYEFVETRAERKAAR
ncbi:MAG: efflux RND transporter permease subunit [Calditrichota bacterium]